MSVGVRLRSQLVDSGGALSKVIETGSLHRVQAANLGIISFTAELATTAIGTAVTDRQNSCAWTVKLILPGSAGPKAEDEEGETELVVAERRQPAAFRTVCTLSQLVSDPRAAADGAGHYESPALDVFGTTA